MFDGREIRWRGKGKDDVEVVEKKEEESKDSGKTVVAEGGDTGTNSGETGDSKVGGGGGDWSAGGVE